MVEVTPLQTASFLLRPRREMLYTLIWVKSGRLKVVADEGEFVLAANNVITITSGQIHYCTDLKGVTGAVLQFTFDYFCKNDRDIELVFHNSLFCHFAMNEVTRMGKSRILEDELKTIGQELHDKPYQYLHSVHSRIEVLLIEINRAKVAAGNEIYKPDALFLKFLEAVRSNFAGQPNTRMIASMLGSTEAKLNQLSRLHTGKTAQNVIYGLVASEAKRLFRYEKLSVKEVAYALGFTDPFYFSNFFKKQTKLSPKAYRESLTA